jgi:hypothetical protein
MSEGKDKRYKILEPRELMTFFIEIICKELLLSNKCNDHHSKKSPLAESGKRVGLKHEVGVQRVSR